MPRRERFDAIVVGAGPAGSVAALVLARHGARVALLERARLPRDKACGDLVGPRGVRVLDDLGVATPGALTASGMDVIGPTGRIVHHPRHLGRTYADHGILLPRRELDRLLCEAAQEAGATYRQARAVDLLRRSSSEAVATRSSRSSSEAVATRPDGGGPVGVTLADGTRLRAEVVVGCDGALSRVASRAGLVDAARVRWGFALRWYADAEAAHPTVLLWERSPWRGFPGYGWIFPGPEGTANLGIGVGVRADRSRGRQAAQAAESFLAELRGRGLLPTGARPRQRCGGWLKMGMVGTVPAHGRVLLAGDAAGLVNPLQGEGISEALVSGRAAAECVLADPPRAAARYRRFLANRYARFHAATVSLQDALLCRPYASAGVARLLTAPGIGPALAPGWALYWNDLLDGSRPSPARRQALVADRCVDLATAASGPRRWVRRALRQPEVVLRDRGGFRQ